MVCASAPEPGHAAQRDGARQRTSFIWIRVEFSELGEMITKIGHCDPHSEYTRLSSTLDPALVLRED